MHWYTNQRYGAVIMILCEDFFVWDLKRVRRQANFLCVLRILKLKKKSTKRN